MLTKNRKFWYHQNAAILHTELENSGTWIEASVQDCPNISNPFLTESHRCWLERSWCHACRRNISMVCSKSIQRQTPNPLYMSLCFVSMSGATDWWERGIQAKANWGLSWLPLQDEDCDGHSGDGDGESCHVFALSCGVWSGSTQVCSERLHGQDRRPKQACEWNHWGQKGQEQEEVRAPEGEEYRRALLFLESGWECEYVSMLLWKHHCWGEALNLIPCYSHSDCTDASRAKTTASELGDIIGQYEYALQDWAYIRFSIWFFKMGTR